MATTPTSLQTRLDEWCADLPPKTLAHARALSGHLYLNEAGTELLPAIGGYVHAELPLYGFLSKGVLGARCSCRASRRGKCEHEAALVVRLQEELKHGARMLPMVRALKDAVSPPPPEETIARFVEGVRGSSSRRGVVKGYLPDFGWLLQEGYPGLRALPLARPQKASGDAGKPRLLRGAEMQAFLEQHARPVDAPLVALLTAADGLLNAERKTTAFDRIAERIDACRVVSALAGHPEVHWEQPEHRVTIAQRRVAVRVVEEDDELVLDAAIIPEDVEVLAETPSGIVTIDSDERRLEVVWATEPVRDRLDALPERLRVPRAFGPMLADQLSSLGAELDVVLPESLAPREVTGDPRPRLVFEPVLQGATVAIRVAPSAAPERLVPGDGQPVVQASVGGERLRVRRDLVTERVEAERLAARLGLPPEAVPKMQLLESEALLDLLERLEGPDFAAVPVEWPQSAQKPEVLRAAASAKRVQVTSAHDWFAVGGEVEVEGETVALAQLLQARREGRRWVELKRGRYAKVARLLEGSLDKLADLTHEERGRTVLSRAAAALADEVFAGDVEVQQPPAWTKAIARAKAARALDPRPVPALQAELRPYQVEGQAWLRRLAALGLGGVLADDMGLGKTVQTIAALAARAEEGPQLVVCPASVEFGWLRELERFAPSLGRIHLRMAERARALEEAKAGDVVVASYGLVRVELERLQRKQWASVVIDEAQTIKNAATESAKALRAIPAEWKVALTGTPVENHLGELHSILGTVAPGVLGSWEQFARAFATPIERGGDRERSRALARLVAPILLRRTKGQVLTELPPRTEVRVDVVLSKTERALYEGARRDAVALLAGGGAEVEGDRRFQVLAALTRLRQLACAPRMVVPQAPPVSEKLRALFERLDEVVEEGHSALVFSSFVKQLDLVGAELEKKGTKYLRLTGETPQPERARLVDAFQRGEARIFLVSLKAGGTGLNLTAADTVFILDPWWNPAVEDQAADRAHRMGQTRPVTIVRLVAKDTVEERVLALHERKRGLVASVLGEADTAGRLSTEDLVDLLREGQQAGAAEEAEEPAAVDERPAPAKARKARGKKEGAAGEPTYEAANSGFRAWVREAYYGSTASGYRVGLNAVVRDLDHLDRPVTQVLLEGLRNPALRERYAAPTLRVHASAVSVFVRWLREGNLIDAAQEAEVRAALDALRR